MYGNPLLLAALPVAELALMLAVFAALPERYYYQSKIRPIVSVRVLAMMRVTFLSLMFGALAWATFATGDWWAAYYFWLLLRQIVQHGNGDRGWLTNSRVFVCHPLINFAVFPLGQDYHLPHHMFSTIPHYRLKELHAALLDCAEYREGAPAGEPHGGRRPRPGLRAA
jgi:fatty acid desaturase